MYLRIHSLYRVHLRKNRHRWEDNIKLDLQKIGCEGVDTVFVWLRIRSSGGLLWTQ